MRGGDEKKPRISERHKKRVGWESRGNTEFKENRQVEIRGGGGILRQKKNIYMY